MDWAQAENRTAVREMDLRFQQRFFRLALKPVTRRGRPRTRRKVARPTCSPSPMAGSPSTVLSSPPPPTPDTRGRPSAALVQLRVIEDMAHSTAVSQATSDFLLLHARTLPPGEIDHYAVNTQLAEQWFAAHPEPEAVKQAAAKARST